MIVFEVLANPDLSDPKYWETLGREAHDVLSSRAFSWFELLSPQVQGLTLSIRYIFDPQRDANRRLRVFIIISGKEEANIREKVSVGLALLSDGFRVIECESRSEFVPPQCSLACLHRHHSIEDLGSHGLQLRVSFGDPGNKVPSLRLDETMAAIGSPCFLDVQVCATRKDDLIGVVASVIEDLEQRDDIRDNCFASGLLEEYREIHDQLSASLIARVAVVAGAESREYAATLLSAFGNDWTGNDTTQIAFLDESDEARVDELFERGLPFHYADAGITIRETTRWYDKSLAQRLADTLEEEGVVAFVPRLAILSELPFLYGRDDVRRALTLPLPASGYLRTFPQETELPPIESSVQPETVPGQLVIGRSTERGGTVSIPINDLTRHAFIAGVTGSGKTVTMTNLLRQLQEQEIPFLVLEPAKSEYRSLAKDPFFGGKLRIVTAGREVVPLRMNPFVFEKSLTLAEHVANLMTAFSAAMPLETWLPTILESSIYRAYEDRGWNEFDYGDAGHELPGIDDLMPAVESVVNELEYGSETSGNAKGAIRNRLVRLTRGSVGSIFRSSFTWPSTDDLFSGPTILELESLVSEHANLVTMFVLMAIRQRLRDKLYDGKAPRLVVILEEAHNLIPASSQSESTSTAESESSKFICRMLAETRALGLGVLVVDQSPAAVAQEVLRSTNLKIAHRTTALADRDSMSDSMLLDDARHESLAKLRRGQAFVYAENLARPLHVELPNWCPGSDSSADTLELSDQSLSWDYICDSLEYLVAEPWTRLLKAKQKLRQLRGKMTPVVTSQIEFDLRLFMEKLNFIGPQTWHYLTNEQKAMLSSEFSRMVNLVQELTQELHQTAEPE